MAKNNNWIAMVAGIALALGAVAIALHLFNRDATQTDETPPSNDDITFTILKEIRDDARMQIPVGEVYDRQVVVSSAVTLLDASVNDGRPLNWSSVDIVNKGPDPIYACVNEWLDPQASILMNQSMNFDFKKRGSIQKLYLKCDNGNTATVDLHILE